MILQVRMALAGLGVQRLGFMLMILFIANVCAVYT
jgi:hypothetical protein